MEDWRKIHHTVSLILLPDDFLYLLPFCFGSGVSKVQFSWKRLLPGIVKGKNVENLRETNRSQMQAFGNVIQAKIYLSEILGETSSLSISDIAWKMLFLD